MALMITITMCLKMQEMAAILFVIALACMISPSDQTREPPASDLEIAMAEMKAGSYYGFVMVLQMVAADRLLTSNVTFLMPSDRDLSEVTLMQNNLPDFLLRHSIPEPLRFNNLRHFPTGSLIPTSLQNYMLKVVNEGRSGFYLNNVRIVSPNICRGSPSIRCHGISGVLNASDSYPGPLGPPVSPPGPAPAPAPAPIIPVLPPPPHSILTPAPQPSPRPSNPAPPSPIVPGVSPSAMSAPAPSPSISPFPNIAPIFNGTGKGAAGLNLLHTSILLVFSCSIASFLVIAHCPWL